MPRWPNGSREKKWNMIHSDKIEKIDTVHGRFFALKDDMISAQLKTYSAHTRNELSMILSFVGEGDHVIDIGAHIGTFCVPLSGRLGDGGKVYAFEGDPDNYELLQKNIAENGKQQQIEAVYGVVSDERRSFKKMVTNASNSMATYFVAGEESDDDGAQLDSVHIDDWFYRDAGRAPIDLLKIDTEGHEVSVLNSCRRIIEAFKPIIYCEINRSAMKRFQVTPGDVESILVAQGYHLFRNIGDRNSQNDEFVLARLKNLDQGGRLFDVLAVHPAGSRYPERFKKSIWVDIHNAKSRSHALGRKVLRNLRIIPKSERTHRH
jgi:FkbM family methyltransferase